MEIDSGEYSCVATNKHGFNTHITQLIVREYGAPDDSVSEETADETVLEGKQPVAEEIVEKKQEAVEETLTTKDNSIVAKEPIVNEDSILSYDCLENIEPVKVEKECQEIVETSEVREEPISMSETEELVSSPETKPVMSTETDEITLSEGETIALTMTIEGEGMLNEVIHVLCCCLIQMFNKSNKIV